MANLKRKPFTHVHETEFRYVPGIEALEKKRLEELGFYQGFPCHFGHTIRDIDHHWCYHCVLKIKSNICGFDVNYLNANYQHPYHNLWKLVEVGASEDCWPIHVADAGNKSRRVTMSSYRLGIGANRKDNVSIHKALYQCAWGDIGSMVVTRTCKNLNCGNPLHMVSSWNRLHPPATLHPFVTTFDPAKLVQFAHFNRQGKAHIIIEHSYKNTIKHPLAVPDAPYYDEG